MAEAFRENRVKAASLIGPLTRLGASAAFLIFTFDQAVKYWLLHIVKMPDLKQITIARYFELIMAWNRGVSYGLFKTENQALLITASLAISALLWVWLARSDRPLTATALGMIIGGALSNALDRLLHGAVADFFYFHVDGLNFALLNFIFNPADVAIVAGVGLLLYEGVVERKGR